MYGTNNGNPKQISFLDLRDLHQFKVNGKMENGDVTSETELQTPLHGNNSTTKQRSQRGGTTKTVIETFKKFADNTTFHGIRQVAVSNHLVPLRYISILLVSIFWRSWAHVLVGQIKQLPKRQTDTI